jgi:hypothetical protein
MFAEGFNGKMESPLRMIFSFIGVNRIPIPRMAQRLSSRPSLPFGSLPGWRPEMSPSFAEMGKELQSGMPEQL